MPTRWAVERELKASELSPSSRLVMLVLLTQADTKTAVIPPAHTPSLTVIARETGLDRVTVQRHLRRLEKDGWVLRCRPPIRAARANHARTGYHCTTPGLDAPGIQAGCTVHLGLDAQRTPGLDAQRTSYQTDLQTDVRSPRVSLTAVVIAAVREHTGKTITEEDAERAIKIKLDGRVPRDPARYLTKVIATDPKWWLPTPMPPKYTRPKEGTQIR